MCRKKNAFFKIFFCTADIFWERRHLDLGHAWIRLSEMGDRVWCGYGQIPSLQDWDGDALCDHRWNLNSRAMQKGGTEKEIWETPEGKTGEKLQLGVASKMPLRRNDAYLLFEKLFLLLKSKSLLWCSKLCSSSPGKSVTLMNSLMYMNSF